MSLSNLIISRKAFSPNGLPQSGRGRSEVKDLRGRGKQDKGQKRVEHMFQKVTITGLDKVGHGGNSNRQNNNSTAGGFTSKVDLLVYVPVEDTPGMSSA